MWSRSAPAHEGRSPITCKVATRATCIHLPIYISCRQISYKSQVLLDRHTICNKTTELTNMDRLTQLQDTLDDVRPTVANLHHQHDMG